MDQQAFRDYFDEGLDQRDRDQIDAYVSRQDEIYATFRRTADDHGIDPEPVPHIHDDHEEKAGRCRITTWLCHLVGALIGLGWSYAASEHSIPVSLGAVLLYVTMAAILDVCFVAFAPRSSFCQNFRFWYLPMVPVCLIAAAILLAERFASPDLAAFLLNLDSAAWLGLEISMLILGAVTMVGQRRFGWSGVLTHEYRALENSIADLRRKIDARKRAVNPPPLGPPPAETPSQPKQPGYSSPSRLSGLVIAVFLLGLMIPRIANASCPAVFDDQTGSVAEPDVKEERLSLTLAAGMAKSSGNLCLNMTPFSANPFSAVGHEIRFTEHRPTPFTPMRLALEAKLKIEALAKIRSSLRPRLQIARCSNISDVLTVAAGGSEDALVYTDGKFDCKATPSTGVTSDHAVIVVLTRSLSDGDSNAETFSARRAATLKMMPKAIVLPEFELDHAVRMLLHLEGQPGLVNAVF